MRLETDRNIMPSAIVTTMRNLIASIDLFDTIVFLAGMILGMVAVAAAAQIVDFVQALGLWALGAGLALVWAAESPIGQGRPTSRA